MFLGLPDPHPDQLVRDMDPDPNPVILESDPQNNFFSKFICLLLLDGTFTSFFKDKKSKRSHKTVRIKVFFTIFA